LNNSHLTMFGEKIAASLYPAFKDWACGKQAGQEAGSEI